MAIDVGPRLREVRERNGLSQRALAKRSGISNATISLIESTKLNPSVAVLKRILDGIPMDLSAFFATGDRQPEPVVYRADELVEIGRGKISYRQVGQDLTGRALQVLLERYQPGADTGEALLRHESEESGVVVSGELEVTVGDQRRVVKAGEAYYFDSRLPHRFRNLGKEEALVVSACTPPSF